MGKLFRNLLLYGLIILPAVVIIKTITFSSRQIDFPAVAASSLPQNYADRLAQAVQIPTVSKSNYIDTAAFIELDTFIQRSYPLVDSLLERRRFRKFSYLYKFSGKNPKLDPVLLLAHQDVVPVEGASAARWTFEPYSGKIAEGYLLGRGTMDDKSSVFGLLEAVEQLLREDYLPERTIYLAFGHDEEVGGSGARAIAEYFATQNIQLAYVLDEGQVILENGLDGLEKPLAMIGIAEKGYATLEIKVQLEEGGHSSMPPRDAVVNVLSEALLRLRDRPAEASVQGATAEFFRHVGPEMTLPYKVLFANSWLTEPILRMQLTKDAASNALLRTTYAPTILSAGVKDNVLPTEASALVNVRIIPGESVASVIRHIERTLDDARISVRVHEDMESFEPMPVSPTDNFGYQVIQRSVKEVFPDVVVAPSLVIATTDSRAFRDVSPNIYRFLPLKMQRSDLSRIHGINERISVEDYGNMIRFYRQLLVNSTR